MTVFFRSADASLTARNDQGEVSELAVCTSSVLYLSLLCEDLFVVQPTFLTNITEGDGSQFRGGVALGAGLLLGLEAF